MAAPQPGLMAKAALVCVLVAASIALAATTAQAHVALVRTSPAHKEGLRQLPPEVHLWFSGPIEPGLSSAEVWSHRGFRADAGQAQVNPDDPAEMVVPLRSGLGPDFYIVFWEVVSKEDGELTKGQLWFALLNPDGSLPYHTTIAETRGGGLPDPLAVLVRWQALTSAVVLVGGLAFAALVAVPAPSPSGCRLEARAVALLQETALVAIVLLSVAGVARLVLLAHELGDLSTLGNILGTRFGQFWWIRQILLAVLAVLLLALARWQAAMRTATVAWLLRASLALSVGVLLTFTLTSHATVHSNAPLAGVSFFVHLAAAALWIGALIHVAFFYHQIARVVPREDGIVFLATGLRRFSLLAIVSVALLLITGVGNALLVLPSAAALVDTDYGRTLLAKLALVTPLLMVASVNAFRLRPRFVASVSTALPTMVLSSVDSGTALAVAPQVANLERRLFHMIRLEAALGVAVLVVVAILTELPPIFR